MKSLIASALCLAVLLVALPARADVWDYRTLYVLTIGINEYQDPNYNLKYSVADSRDFASAIERGGKNVFDAVRVRTLTDAQATRAAIEEEFGKIAAAARPFDTFVFHFAGNGSVVEDAAGGAPAFHMFTYDIGTVSDKAQLAAKGISGRLLGAWTSKIQARQQLILLDSCHSGSAFNKLSSSIAGESDELRELAGKNIVVMGMDALTFERAEWGHGEFSYALIEGLKGEADLSGDGRITTRELQAHMYGKMPKLRLEAKAEIVFPKMYEVGEDFPLVAMKKAAPEKPKTVAADTAAAIVARADAQAAPSRDITSGATPSDGGKAVAARREGKDYALLFAINDYDDEGFTDLSNPVLDARAIAKELKENYGFDTRVVENPKLEDIFTVLREYAGREFKGEDQLFIFFAGHGTFDEVVKEGFIVARDSRKDDVNKVGYLAHSRLNSVVDNINCPHILVSLDVCFGGTFTDHVRKNFSRKSREDTGQTSMFTGLELFKKKSEFTTRIFLASGANVPVSDGVPGRHSPFAAKMLEALRSYPGTGYLTFGDIKKSVERVKPGPVEADFGSFLPGSDFFFILGRS
ncbi:MAG TPA: caspase family protein [Pyrinomonadaceae bacterium]|nr:caspase family protein [Pyrinomonadaceae bacterium]